MTGAFRVRARQQGSSSEDDRGGKEVGIDGFRLFFVVRWRLLDAKGAIYPEGYQHAVWVC